jgi:hypothetical protein
MSGTFSSENSQKNIARGLRVKSDLSVFAQKNKKLITAVNNIYLFFVALVRAVHRENFLFLFIFSSLFH